MTREELVALFDSKSHAYKRTFDNQNGLKVLRDLADFCRANEPTFDPDPRIHALLEGRREVWLRLQKYLNLTPEQLLQLRTDELQSLSKGKSGA